MNARRVPAVLALAALPLALVATPALAEPPLPQVKRVTEGPFDGTLHTLNTHTNKIKLTDRTVIRYDKNDHLKVQHLYDTEPSEDEFLCDLRDSGGEDLAQAFVDAGYTLRVNGTILRPRSEESLIIVTADTCDGTVDASDVSPTLPTP